MSCNKRFNAVPDTQLSIKAAGVNGFNKEKRDRNLTLNSAPPAALHSHLFSVNGRVSGSCLFHLK